VNYGDEKLVSALTMATQEFVHQKESARRQGQERVKTKTREWTAWETEHTLRIERNVPAWYAELARLEAKRALAELNIAEMFVRECEVRIDAVIYLGKGDEIKGKDVLYEHSAIIEELHKAMNEESAKIWEYSERIRVLWADKESAKPYAQIEYWA
jgi:hypothetical protein